MDIDMIVVMVSLQKLRYLGCSVDVERSDLECTGGWSFGLDFYFPMGSHCHAWPCVDAFETVSA